MPDARSNALLIKPTCYVGGKAAILLTPGANLYRFNRCIVLSCHVPLVQNVD